MTTQAEYINRIADIDEAIRDLRETVMNPPIPGLDEKAQSCIDEILDDRLILMKLRNASEVLERVEKTITINNKE